MNIAIIPARGGSKRIPKKNIKNFCGIPIIAYAIKEAIASKLFDYVLVSTDCEEIAKVALDFGAIVPFFRPKELSDDFTFTVPVIKHAVEWFESNISNLNFVCCIYATNPFIKKEYLIDSYNLLVSKNIKGYVFSVTEYPFPIQRALIVNSNHLIEMINPEMYNVRSQDLDKTYHDACQFYWGSAVNFKSEKFFYSNDSFAYILPKHLVQDIDNIDDWKRAEIMYQIINFDKFKRK